MASRDRTEEFLQLRGTRRQRKGNDKDSLLGGDSEMRPVPVMPAWVAKMEDVRGIERQISQKLQELETMHAGHLKVQFGVSRDEEKEERDIERTTNFLNKRFKDCEAMIKELDIVFKSELKDGGTDAELSVLRNVKMCLINETTALSRVFRDTQRRYLRDLQKQKGVRQRWAGGTERQKAIQEEMERDAAMNDYLSKGMTQDQIESIMINRRIVEDREKEFQDIYQSIKALHEMFKDLNALVIEQGTVLDRIDYNMNLTHERVTKARKELQKAAEHQKAGRFKLLVLFLIVLIIGFTLALLFKIAS